MATSEKTKKKKVAEDVVAYETKASGKSAPETAETAVNDVADNNAASVSATRAGKARKAKGSDGAPRQFREKGTASGKTAADTDVSQQDVAVSTAQRSKKSKKTLPEAVKEEIPEAVKADAAAENGAKKKKTAKKSKAETVSQEDLSEFENADVQTSKNVVIAEEVNPEENAPVADSVSEQTAEQDVAEDAKVEEQMSRAQEKADKDFRKLNKKNKFVGELERVQPDPSFGLTEEQVQERFARGMNNVQPNVVSKSYIGIFRSNVLTLFNFINFVLAALIFVYGELKNMLFIGVVTVNIIVGVVQEIRSKKVLEKMSLIAAPHVDLVRGGNVVKSEISDIVIDDIMILKQGMQIPSDSIVVDGQCEVNESLLTGEQDDVHKQNGDFLYSGSFVQAGECKARVSAVGADNFTSKLMAEAKKFKKPKSELMRSINWIIRIVTLAIFPLGLLMFYTNKITTSTINEAVFMMFSLK